LAAFVDRRAMADVKFCGLTRSDDAREAVRIGASFLGVIFAGGPRTLTGEAARNILRDAPRSARRVGVFGAASPADIAELTALAGLDIVQLHADPDAELVRSVRRAAGRPVWAAVRIRGDVIPESASSLFAEADGVVLDARSDHVLGGTGQTLEWANLAARLAPLRGRAKLVLAGGLTAANVAEAVAALGPDIVDVSSGVESAPGIKDHQLMRAFIGAARSTPRVG
jgi:phosphoribosylanthranilate isomerase